MPSLHTLYWNDPAFRRAAEMLGFGLFAAILTWWFTRPMSNADPTAEFELVAKYGPPIALGLAALGLIGVAWRYVQVHGVFTRGETVTGTVVDLKTDTWETTANRNQSHGINKITQRSYHATVSYTVRGEEQHVTLRLPHDPSHYGMKRGGAVELQVLESAPRKPLVRAVYFEKVKMKWLF